LRAPFEADQRQGARQTAPYFFGSALPPMDALLFPGRLRPGKRSASIGRRL